jgi:hypothetical protein
MSVRMLCPGNANCYLNGPAFGITIHMNRALSSCRDTTLAIWLLPSGISDMQTTFPRLSKLIAASPPGRFSRRRQGASVCNASQVLDYEAQQRSLDSDNSNRNDTGGKFAGKIAATCYTATNKMNSFKQLELVIQSSRGVQ